MKPKIQLTPEQREESRKIAKRSLALLQIKQNRLTVLSTKVKNSNNQLE